MPILYGFFFALLTALIDIGGDVTIKEAAEKRGFFSGVMAIGFMLYALSAIAWFFTMRYVGLGQGAVFYSMLSLIAVVLIGVFWFGEALDIRRMFGLGFALAAMVLMSARA